MGLPIAALADRRPRTRIIAAGLFLWSLMTATCGLARGFGTLFLARVGVGVGEATLSPAALSLISDAFPRDRVVRAVSLFVSAQSIGGGIALIVGGSVIAAVSHSSGAAGMEVPLLGFMKPWQLAFLIVGLIGLPFLLLMATVAEPARNAPAGENDSFAAFVQHLRVAAPCLLCITGAQVMTTISGYSSQSWFPTLFVRVHGWSISTAGLVIGTTIAVFGSLGLFATARLTEWLTARGRPDGIMRAMSLGAIGIALGNLLLAQGSLPAAIVGMAAMVFCNASAAIVPAALQLTTPNRLRARVSALFLFAVNLLGLGLGPTLVAATTDYVFGDPKAVGSSVALVGFIAACAAAVVFRLGCGPYRAALERAEGIAAPAASAVPSLAAAARAGE
jgi:MFS family permease